MFEKVNPSHPDKVADRIAGALVDLAYAKEDYPRIAVEVLLTEGLDVADGVEDEGIAHEEGRDDVLVAMHHACHFERATAACGTTLREAGLQGAGGGGGARR